MNMIHHVLARAGADGGGGCGTLLSSVEFVCACSNPFRLVLPNHIPPFPSLSWESGGVYLILLVYSLLVTWRLRDTHPMTYTFRRSTVSGIATGRHSSRPGVGKP